MAKGDKLIFAHGDWHICRIGQQGEPRRPVWEYRSGAYCCDVGAEVASADLPARPGKGAKAEPDWLELAWKLSGSGMSKRRFAEVYGPKVGQVAAAPSRKP